MNEIGFPPGIEKFREFLKNHLDDVRRSRIEIEDLIIIMQHAGQAKAIAVLKDARKKIITHENDAWFERLRISIERYRLEQKQIEDAVIALQEIEKKLKQFREHLAQEFKEMREADERLIALYRRLDEITASIVGYRKELAEKKEELRRNEEAIQANIAEYEASAYFLDCFFALCAHRNDYAIGCPVSRLDPFKI